ncbi:ArnT family glycosyltransferase [Tsuneonella mangrovi]|uniref:ArnT family glycosyltransferase n=1 Tax=Tsuneonella mangrovi TaxID=1982042 RepID=UPI000BA2650D|nr:glycosyltransferase family 39 protein [Tsuneonella mangrovi]
MDRIGEAGQLPAPDSTDAIPRIGVPAWRARAIEFAILAVVVFGVRSIWFGDPIVDFDEQLYSLIGWKMTHGLWPYTDLWDRKPFGLFALFALAHWIGGPDAIAYQILAALFTFVGALLVADLARPISGRGGAIIAGALYCLLMCRFGSAGGQAEAFFMPVMLGMVWLLRDPLHPRFLSRAAVAMLLGGLALQIKYTAIPQCLLLGGWALYWLWRRAMPLGRLAGVACGFAILGLSPTIAVGLLYLANGHFSDFWFANFVSFFLRTPFHNDFPVGYLIWILGPLTMMALLGLYTALRLNPPVERLRYLLFVLWGLSTITTVYLPPTTYPYYFAALVPAAVLVAAPMLDTRIVLGRIVGPMMILGTLMILGLPQQRAFAKRDTAQTFALANAIKPHLSPHHCLLVFDGPTALYRLTNSCLPTRFIYPDHLNNDLEHDSLGTPQTVIMREVLTNRPPVIVTSEEIVTVQNKAVHEMVYRAIDEHYRKLTSSQIAGRTIVAWLRKPS